jgi:hypothetical protein
MSYTKDIDIRIPADKVDEAATLLGRYFEIEGWIGGGAEAVIAAFDDLELDASVQPDGSVAIDYYDGEGNPEHLSALRLLAGLIPDGSYIIWADEDGPFERWLIERGELREQLPETVWQDA